MKKTCIPAGLFAIVMLGVHCSADVAVIEQLGPDKPVVNVMDHGAVGDGRTNDSAAFRAACAVLTEAGGGTLVIPKATYIVGEQLTGLTPDHPYSRYRNKNYPFYKYTPTIAVQDADGLLIEGNGATMRMADGLRIGSFDKDTGERFDPPEKHFTDYAYQAAPGNIIELSRCRNVQVRDLELDGNSDHLVLGGSWGDTGRQCMAHGIAIYSCRDVLVRDLYTHHHGLDGVMIAWSHLKESDPPTPHTLINIRSEYNGRQGLSWVGGRGLTVLDSRFNHTGRGAIQSAPAAGLDIEAEVSICRDGLFRNCQFIDNAGCGIVADCGDGGYTRFENCTIWGTTNWSVWAGRPGLSFDNCDIFGSIVPGYGSDDPSLATRYTDCRFEDRPWPGRGVYRSTALIIQRGQNVTFDRCTVNAFRTKALYIDGGDDHEVLRDCTITHHWADATDHDFQSIVRGVTLERVRFQEAFPPGLARKFYIAAQNVQIGAGVEVAGPCVKMWNWSWGVTGTIEPPRPAGE